MKQVYVENVYGYLIPVAYVKASERRPNHYNARVQETGHGYYENEMICQHRTAFVVKAGTTEYGTLVRPYRVSA